MFVTGHDYTLSLLWLAFFRGVYMYRWRQLKLPGQMQSCCRREYHSQYLSCHCAMSCHRAMSWLLLGKIRISEQSLGTSTRLISLFIL